METISLNVSENLKESSKQALVVPVSPDEYYLVPDPSKFLFLIFVFNLFFSSNLFFIESFLKLN